MEWEYRYNELAPRNLMLFSLGFAVFSACVVVPPPAFTRAGFTVESLFSETLGSERTDFVGYHIRRTSLVLACHCALPLLYTGMVYTYYSDLVPSLTAFGVPVLPALATAVALAAGTVIFICASHLRDASSRPLWVGHPLVRALEAYGPRGWGEVAASVCAEVAGDATEVFVRLGVTTVVTDSWVCVVGTYSVVVAHLRDVVLRVDPRRTVEREVAGEVEQVLGVEVTEGRAGRAGVVSAVIRVASTDWARLNARLQGVIVDARGVLIQQTLDERFLTALEEVVAANTAALDSPATRTIEAEPGDLCAGCLASPPEVRLVARCGRPACESCFCRPMWCLSCLGRWFLAKQRERRTGPAAGWLADGQAPCPTCRRVFCALDIVKVV